MIAVRRDDGPRVERMGRDGPSGQCVPGRGVRKAVVGTAVDDDGLVRQGCRERGRVAVWEGEDDGVVADEDLGRRLLEDDVGDGAQVRVDLAEATAGVSPGGDGAELEVGVRGDETDRLTPGVPARADDGDAWAHQLLLSSPGPSSTGCAVMHDDASLYKSGRRGFALPAVPARSTVSR